MLHCLLSIVLSAIVVLCGQFLFSEALYSNSPELQGYPLLLLTKFESIYAFSEQRREVFLRLNEFLNETWKEMLELFQDCISVFTTVSDGYV